MIDLDPNVRLAADMSNHPNRSNRRPGAEVPAPAEIRAAREAAGLTQDEAGALVNSGWRTWQNWESTAAGEARTMHPASWELFTIKCRARKLLEEGKIDAATLKRLGIQLPPPKTVDE